MTRAFTFPGLTTRVVFGAGTLAQAGEEVARLGHARALRSEERRVGKECCR